LPVPFRMLVLRCASQGLLGPEKGHRIHIRFAWYKVGIKHGLDRWQARAYQLHVPDWEQSLFLATITFFLLTEQWIVIIVVLVIVMIMLGCA